MYVHRKASKAMKTGMQIMTAVQMYQTLEEAAMPDRKMMKRTQQEQAQVKEIKETM